MTSKQVSYKCYCPLCGRKFSAKAAWKHINDYHPKASERELMMIRDVKREKISFATKPLNANKNAILYQYASFKWSRLFWRASISWKEKITTLMLVFNDINNPIYYRKPRSEMGVTCVGRQKMKLGSKPLI